MSNDSLVLLQMWSEIINNNNTPCQPHHLCPRTVLHFYFNFTNQTEYQLGRTRLKPNSDFIQELIEMLTAGLTPGSIFSSNCDAKVAGLRAVSELHPQYFHTG